MTAISEIRPASQPRPVGAPPSPMHIGLTCSLVPNDLTQSMADLLCTRVSQKWFDKNGPHLARSRSRDTLALS